MVSLVTLRGPRADEALSARFRAFEANHWQWGGQPGNFALMVKQGFCVNEAVRLGRRKGLDWIFHLDVDELFLPELPKARGGGGWRRRLAAAAAGGGGVRRCRRGAGPSRLPPLSLS